ncbi:MAG: hypothetical protein ACXAC7_20360 [Candidatus Hodarchaeales archaeon]|jgi:hypothetical protein
MEVRLDGGLIWLDYHITNQIQVKAYYYKFEDDQELNDDDWYLIYHHSMPIKGNSVTTTFNLFQINEEIYGVSLFKKLDQERDGISLVSLIWVSTKVTNPMTLIPVLKEIINSAGIKIAITNESLYVLVNNIIENNGQIDYTFESGGQEIQIKSPPFPETLNVPIKFLI